MNAATPLATRVRPPAAVPLPTRFDPARLRADLAALTADPWSLQQTIADDGSLTESPVDWRCLALRSLGGDPSRTDCGGPGVEEFRDTPWLDRTPYLAHVLAAVPGELRAARLMALGPGASSAEHDDTKYGPPWGLARLHVPITTTPGAILVLDGETHQWQPGSFWFGDFSRPHRVRNTDELARVHLVVDTLVDEELLSQFPPEARRLWGPHALLNRPRLPLHPGDAARCAVRFDLPASFAGWEEPDGEFLRPQRTLDAAIGPVGGRVTLSLDGEPAFTLVHVGDGEFRFAGWSDERTVAVSSGAAGPVVTLRSRVGQMVRRADIPAVAA